MAHHSTSRFSDRVANYVKYRPGYPPQVIDCLRAICRPSASTVAADIGSGTGILSALLLAAGYRVVGIEPNSDMRRAAEAMLSEQAGFSSQATTAEATGLPDRSVDLITVAQAFHWFDHTACKREFLRILKPGGWLALMWNERLTDSTPFLRDYERLVSTHGTDYQAVNHTNVSETVIDAFFAPAGVLKKCFSNSQRFDYQGLEGRLLSSSYVPNEVHPGHAAMIADLEGVFARHQQSGVVSFDYVTKVYVGQLGGTLGR